MASVGSHGLPFQLLWDDSAHLVTNLLEDIPDLFVSHLLILMEMIDGAGGWRV